MSPLLESIRNLFTPVQPFPPGVHHYQAPQDDPRNYRLHLRLEEDGSGILIVNAATVLHLNQTAAEYAFYLVKNVPAEQAARNMASRYRISRAQALKDYQDFAERIETLVTTPDLDPVTFLDFDRQAPYSGDISAPYRLDCALTYRLPEAEDPESAPIQRVSRELSTDEWKKVLDKAWQAGIPHVVFTGGEPTLRDDLVELISHTEASGQVSGLLTDGLRFSDADYLNSLLQTGLDHIMIVLQLDLPTAWAALENALKADIFTAVHLTLTPQTKEINSTLERLAEMHVPAVSLSASSPDLSADLQAAREYAAHLDMALIWDLPVPYSPVNPVALEVEGDLPQGAGRAWLYVEPDGDVLPAQGVNEVLGNFLNDPWEKIWKKEGS
jgi:organic radical activating enzyme